MWCQHCQQDVPAIAHPEDAVQVLCARCGQELSGNVPANNHELFSVTASHEGIVLLQPPAFPDEWSWDDDQHAAQSLLTALQNVDSPEELESKLNGVRVDMPHGEDAATSAETAEQSSGQTQSGTVFFGQVMLALGMMAFFFGGVLLVWSLLAGRPALWNVGLPTAMLGQAALVLGAAMRLEGHWQAKRQAKQSASQPTNGHIPAPHFAASRVHT